MKGETMQEKSMSLDAEIRFADGWGSVLSAALPLCSAVLKFHLRLNLRSEGVASSFHVPG